MRLASRIKLGAASLFGFSPNDVYILKSITHRGWIVRAFRPGASTIPVAPYVYAPIRSVAEADIILSERLIAAYRHATSVPHAPTQLSPLWQDNLLHKQSLLRNKLLAGNPRDVAELLATGTPQLRHVQGSIRATSTPAATGASTPSSCWTIWSRSQSNWT